MKQIIMSNMSKVVVAVTLLGLGAIAVLADDCLAQTSPSCPDPVYVSGMKCTINMGFHSGCYGLVVKGEDYSGWAEGGNCCQYTCSDNSTPTFNPNIYGTGSCDD
jgi:hypothetical protein